jgi:hypothetical protein
LPILVRLLPLLLPLALAGAAPPGPNLLFPMAPYQDLGRPWLETRRDDRLFSAPFQARKAEAFRREYLGPWDPAFVAVDGSKATGFMTYQNLWGLRPKAPPDYRAIVGGSVLFPVLDRYPEQPELGPWPTGEGSWSPSWMRLPEPSRRNPIRPDRNRTSSPPPDKTGIHASFGLLLPNPRRNL